MQMSASVHLNKEEEVRVQLGRSHDGGYTITICQGHYPNVTFFMAPRQFTQLMDKLEHEEVNTHESQDQLNGSTGATT